MKGFWGRGVEVIGEWVKKRESGGVGGDPVGSTDPEVSRITHPYTKWRAKMPLLLILALNAGLLPFSGIKRQFLAHSWR